MNAEKLNGSMLKVWNGPTSYGPTGTVRTAEWFDAEVPGHVTVTIRTGRSQGFVGPCGETYEQFDSYMEFSGLRPGDTIVRTGMCGRQEWKIRGNKAGLWAEQQL